MESVQLVLIGNTYIDSVAILASAKNSQFTSSKMHSTCLRILLKNYEHRPKSNYWYTEVALKLVN
jgi:hypothetical protein